MTLELYHHGSSACAAKVRFALAEKRLDWSSHYVDILNGEQFTPAFLALNPKAVVPVLVHDGAVIVESTVICEYLEETFPANALYPATPLERAHVRVWTKAVDEELHPACSAITYVVSHRYTILRNGVGSFEDFLARGANEGTAARTLKWQWIQHGLDAPGAADKIRLYDAYLHKMEQALAASDWLVGGRFTMADVAMAPYVNRLAALAMERLWEGGRLPRVERWFERVRARPTFRPAFVEWLPAALAEEMRANGERSWPAVRTLLGVE
jgi:glutathione S-transferase